VAKSVAATRARLAPEGDASLWGAFVDGELAGALGLVREARLKGRHNADVVAMYVKPEYARRGVGGKLLRHAIASARDAGIEQLTLTVTQTNHAARQLYAAAGFVTFGIEPRAIKVGDVYYAKEHMQLVLGSG